MIRGQQESIDTFKQMLAQLLKKKKKGPKTKGKKEGESSSSEDIESEKHSNTETPKPSSEKEDGLESGSHHSRRMSNPEKHLKVLARQGDLQDVGVVRLPSGMRHNSLPSKVQGTDLIYFR